MTLDSFERLHLLGDGSEPAEVWEQYEDFILRLIRVARAAKVVENALDAFPEASLFLDEKDVLSPFKEAMKGIRL